MNIKRIRFNALAAIDATVTSTAWGRTSFQNLLDLDVIGAEAAVEFEVIGVVKKRRSERKKQLLNSNKRKWRERENKENKL